MIDPQPSPRTVGKWLTLLLFVWPVGICIWAGYIMLLFLGFVRVFGG